MGDRPVDEVLEAMAGDIAALQTIDLDALTGTEVMRLIRSVEVLRRRLDRGTDRLVDHLERTGKHGVDGHKTAKSAVKHLGRLPGAEAHARVRVSRALRLLPAVAGAYEHGHIPTASVRAIAMVAANPRVQPFLDDLVDKVFAEQASEERYDDFVAWLREWERLADADGADQDHERSHLRRDATLVQASMDDSWDPRADTGSLQGACMAEVFAAYEAAEWEADRAEAVGVHGPDATPEQFPRTAAQRRADALHAIFRRAAAAPADAQSPATVLRREQPGGGDAAVRHPGSRRHRLLLGRLRQSTVATTGRPRGTVAGAGRDEQPQRTGRVRVPQPTEGDRVPTGPPGRRLVRPRAPRRHHDHASGVTRPSVKGRCRPSGRSACCWLR